MRQGQSTYRDLAYSQAIEEYQKALGKKNFPEGQIKLPETSVWWTTTAKTEEAYGKVMQLKK